jgi:hypothetical protein
MEIKGKVFKVLPLREGVSASGNAWKMQTIVVEYQDGQYTSKVALDNMKKADEFGKLNVGDEYIFKCNTPTSREYNDRWYTSINCWAWDDGKSTQGATVPATPVAPTPQATTPATKADDDMPF